MADEKYSKLVEPYIDHIAKWRATGASNKQIADKLGISLSSLKNYKKEYIELDNALSYGHSNLSIDIAKTITDLALGYDYITEEVVKLKNGDGSERAEVKKVIRHVPGNLEAAKYFLKNRTKNWNDNPQGFRLKERELQLKANADDMPTGESKAVICDDM